MSFRSNNINSFNDDENKKRSSNYNSFNDNSITFLPNFLYKGKSLNIIGYIYVYILRIYAVYLCFKKNNGFSWTVILALCFPILYITYVYSTTPSNFKMNPFKI